MRTTINIDDAQLADAREMSGITNETELVRAALKQLIKRKRRDRAEKRGVRGASAVADAKKNGRATLNIDDAQLAKAREKSGIEDDAELVREALRTLIRRERRDRAERLGVRVSDGKTDNRA